METSDYWFWTLASTLAALVSFYFAFYYLRKARVIEDTPTALIRSAPQGYVELVGSAALLEETPAVAPLTGQPCCWYRFSIERKGGKSGWYTVEKGESSDPFLLRDATGECIIAPAGAIITTRESNLWYGSSRHPGRLERQVMQTRSLWGLSFRYPTNNRVGLMTNYRYNEELIAIGEPLYAIGWFRSLDDIDHHRSREERMRALLREWKKDPKIMEKFDRDKNGVIDEKEWEAARRAAAYRVRREYQQDLESMVIHTLSRPASRAQPYLLSTLEQFELVKRYRLYSTLLMIGFLLSSVLFGILLLSGPP